MTWRPVRKSSRPHSTRERLWEGVPQTRCLVLARTFRCVKAAFVWMPCVARVLFLSVVMGAACAPGGARASLWRAGTTQKEHVEDVHGVVGVCGAWEGGQTNGRDRMTDKWPKACTHADTLPLAPPRRRPRRQVGVGGRPQPSRQRLARDTCGNAQPARRCDGRARSRCTGNAGRGAR
ncbi:MAG: hypothetical protein J3K34DRAFT_403880 [Monoraphidium minutum]|nr:MAG: hypothetical protein J3K34DRAFT_403880 [Monoraphidium minutum]